MSELQAQPGAENPFAQGSESQPQLPIEDETGSQQPEISHDGVSEPETEPAAEVVHTHESVLTGLMESLEGMAHMAKSEVEALVAHARKLFESL